jgi:hypothetical protein
VRRRAIAGALAGLALLPAAASAHSTVTIQGADLIYASEDAVSNNNLIVDETPTSIRFRDREADNGLQGSAQCTPGDQEGAFAYEMTCPKTGIRLVTIDLGPNEDTAVANMLTIPVSATGANGADSLTVNGVVNDLLSGDTGNDLLNGGDGNDDLRGDEGADTITGGGGNDAIQGSVGADTIDAGAGDDNVLTPDGTVDKVVCGAGIDTVKADTVDEVTPDCEAVERTFVAPPPDDAGAEDKTKPALKVGGSTSQRVSAKRRLVRIAASLSETGEVSASGFLDAGGINTPIKTGRYKVDVAGGGVTILVRLSTSQMKKVLRDLKRRRKVYVRINVVGADRAGNSVVAKTLKIRLRK